MSTGWWAALPASAALYGIAGAVGAADTPRRLVAVLLLTGGIAGAVVLRRRTADVLPAPGAGWTVAAGAAGAFLVGALPASMLLERGTWWASILTAVWAMLGIGAGALATWCIVREVDGAA